jgi:hypothetical protein
VQNKVNCKKTGLGAACLTVAALLVSSGICAAQNSTKGNASPSTTQNVNVVNTPSVSVSGSVTVGNTAAQPVPGVDVERLARIPYQKVVAMASASCGVGSCGANISVPAVPGTRLVIEHVSAVVYLLSGTTAAPILQFYQSSNGVTHGLWTFAGSNGAAVSGEVLSAINGNPKGYFASGGGLITVNVFGNINTLDGADLTLTGYLENCAVTGCPIQTN